MCETTVDRFSGDRNCDMASTSLHSARLLSKFRGCLLGSLIGDCLGSPFEGEAKPICRVVMKSYMEKLRDPNLKVPYKPYTDDSAMTLGVARSLVRNRGFNAREMAERFVNDFYAESKRGYGAHIVDVFAALKLNDFEDPYAPAQLQFGGGGSWGNGAAMRVSPIALFSHTSDSQAIELARQSALITHSHKLGYRGAILQCLAIHRAVNSNPDIPLDIEAFVAYLRDKMSEVEGSDEKQTNNGYHRGNGSTCFVEALEKMHQMLHKETASPDLVADTLGNNASAIGSVPTAIYSFLRAFREEQEPDACKPVDPELVPAEESLFEKTVRYAIGVGGDTDTIASMAGSIAGAYVGEEGIPHILLRHCEAAEEVQQLADSLYEISK